MHAFRLFFVLVATCVGFVMVVGTVLGVGFGAMELFDINNNDEGAVVMVFGALILCFLAFMRVVSRVVGDVTRGLDSKHGIEQSADEAKIMQDLHQGMVNMAQRVESLETILLDRAPSGRREDTARY